MNFFEGELAQGADGMFFKNEWMNVRVDDRHVAKLSSAGQQKVTMGIRPEHVQDSAWLTSPNADTLVPSNVEVVEPMGAEIMLYLSVGNSAYIARVDGQDSAKAGNEISMSFDMPHASYFEPGEMGSRLV